MWTIPMEKYEAKWTLTKFHSFFEFKKTKLEKISDILILSVICVYFTVRNKNEAE